MKQVLILWLLICLLAIPVQAMEFTPPDVTGEAQKYFPEETESFSDGLREIIQALIRELEPQLAEAASVSASLIGVILLVSLLRTMSGHASKPTELAAVCVIGTILLGSANSMIRLGMDTIRNTVEYGSLLLPVMTAALAAQGAVNSSATLYASTTAVIGFLTNLISDLLIPLVYIFIALSIAGCAIGSKLLKDITAFSKWLITWCLKLSVYFFTGYMSITGVVTGSADASALKATKLTFSGMVPVVGSVIADASEAVLASAGIMRSAAGIYGILAMLSILAGPFLKIGTHYLLLKLTTGVCTMIDDNAGTALIRSFTTAMGFVMAMIGTISVMLLISTVCFMKGVGT